MKGNIKRSFLCSNVWRDFNFFSQLRLPSKQMTGPSLVGLQRDGVRPPEMEGKKGTEEGRHEQKTAETKNKKWAGVINVGGKYRHQKRRNETPRKRNGN